MKKALLATVLAIFLVTTSVVAADIYLAYDLKKIQRTVLTNTTCTLRALLIICDAYESPENNLIAQSVRIDLNTVTQFLNLLEKRNIVKVERTVLQGRNATMQNIQNSLLQLSAESDDVLLVFFSGHGGMEKGQSFLLTADEKLLWRNDLQYAISDKNARLKIVITDACSNEVGELQVSRSLSRGTSAAQEGEYDHIYKTLFLNYEGFMHLSSSSEGEFAWSDSNLGGFFTHYFVREGLIKKPSESWEEIFKTAKEKTAQMYDRIPATQRSELASQGIKSQTAKAFSLPKLKKDSSSSIAVNYNTQTTNAIDTKKTAKAIIENKTNRKIECWVADGVLQNWRMLKIDAMATVEIPIKKNYITLGFDSDGENIYYDLENGKFVFQEDYNGYLDLFEAQDIAKRGIGAGVGDTNNTPKTRFTAFDWVCESEEGWVVVRYEKDGTFLIYDDKAQLVGEGDWEIERKEIKGRKETLLVEIEEDEEGNEYQTKYQVLTEDEEMILLSLYEYRKNGELIEENIPTRNMHNVFVMYKQPRE